jgi:hypothetical protein
MPSKKSKIEIKEALASLPIEPLVLFIPASPELTDSDGMSLKPATFDIIELKGIQFNNEFISWASKIDSPIYKGQPIYVVSKFGKAKISKSQLLSTMGQIEFFLKNAAELLQTPEQRLMGEPIVDRNFAMLCGSLYNKDASKAQASEASTKLMVKTLREVKTFSKEIAKAQIQESPLGQLHGALSQHGAVSAYLEQKEAAKQLRLANK